MRQLRKKKNMDKEEMKKEGGEEGKGGGEKGDVTLLQGK